MAASPTDRRGAGVHVYRQVGFVLGPGLAVLMLLAGPPAGMEPAAWRTAAAAVWMAAWWMTEAAPVAVTALLPLVLFPLLTVSPMKETAAPYAHPMIYLFLGGFMIARAIEKWNLHKRIALHILLFMGSNGRSLVAGFMMAGAALSMWVTNTATTMMLLPIALAIIAMVDETATGLSPRNRRNFRIVLLLGIAYAATIGGMATLVGTPPNALLAGFMMENYGVEIGFGQWMAVGLPLSLVMLPLCWLILTRLVYPVAFTTSGETRSLLVSMLADLGPIGAPEKRVAYVFALTAAAWISRPLLDNWPPLAGLSDPGIAMTAGLALFVLPAGGGARGPLLDWDTARGLPWGILILFGGGLSLAAAVSSSGLALDIGAMLATLDALSLAVLVVVTATLIIFLTELTNNLATTATFLPVVAAIATQLGYDPMVLAVPVALAASCAFMLPVATPPNAIVYGSEQFSIPQMARAGAAINVLGIVLVTVVSLVLVPAILK